LDDSGFPPDSSQQIHHVHLMLEYGQRHDVALLCQIAVRIESSGERRPVGRAAWRRLVVQVLEVGISEVMQRLVLPRDVPASPPSLERDTVRHRKLPRTPNEHPGN